jgi:hypothetical protein
MRSEFGYAWGKLYLAIHAMAVGTAPLPQRVAGAFRAHLSTLGPQNLPPFAHERFKAMRAMLAASPDDADEDHTFEFAPVTPQQAAAVAEEILSIYDEIARTDARERVSQIL